MKFDVLSFVMGQQAGKASGGGSGDYSDVHFVTFMSEDGTTELYKRAVVDGDDCADPVKRGYIDEPTKESTVNYNYTLVGWSATPNGALDENILKSVTADKTVYANFAAVLRYYTVTYYDDDGTTVLKTESLAYGATPSYKPTKDGFDFVEWTPKEAVSGDMSYTAVWKVKAAFETATWAEIAAICEAGTAEEYFKVGDKKPVTLTYSDGTSETINFTIVDMGVDTLTDKTKGAITCMADNIPNIGIVKPATAYNKASSTLYDMSNSKTALENIFNALPSELQDVIEPYKINAYFSTGTNIFCPYAQNLGLTVQGTNVSTPMYPNTYKYFANGASIKRTKLNNQAADDYWTNSVYYLNSTGSYTLYRYAVIDGTTLLDGMTTPSPATVPTNDSHYLVPCFCVGKKGA